jgi:NTE family protein
MHHARRLQPLLLLLLLLPPLLAAAPTDAARPKTCLVLSGGGARGIAHIGVLKVLEELRVPVDCIVGTSAGAIIGGVYASGAAPAEIETAIRGADWDLLLTDRPARPDRSVYARELDRAHVGIAEVGARGQSLLLPKAVVAGEHLQYFLQSLVSPSGRGAFDRLPIQYRALATDFENGQLVVLDGGDLATAIRASMSVPGAFAPVELNDRVLVDGGLVRNIGIDVARALGAERIIAVNTGTPLLRRNEIDSILSAATQMLNILAEQNVATSLAQLGPADVLIEPELGAFSATDFAHGVDHIIDAELATRRRAVALEAFAVSEREYRAWRDGQRIARTPTHYDEVVVDTSGLRQVPPMAIERLVGLHPKDAEATVTRLLATDDFETVTASLEPRDGTTALVLRPREKPWGPNYLHGGVMLATDFAGNSDFTLLADQRMTWLTESGLEWRNRASFGHRNSLNSELRQPLEPTRRYFVAPRIDISERIRSLYVDGSALASYKLRDLRGGVDLGARLGQTGELRLGLEAGRTDATLAIGSPLLPNLHERLTAWRASLIVDRLDNLDFPRQGFMFSADAHLAREVLGGTQHYDRLSVELERAFGTDRSSLLLAARVQTSFGGDLPPNEAFSLGGFQNMSGYREDQLLVNRVVFLRAVYRRQVANFSALVPALYAGFSLEAADATHPLDTTRGNHLYGGSLFLSADSALGPLYLGTGVAGGGFVSVYLYLGRP